MKYALVLNDMRSSNIENIRAVKVSSNRQELVDWYNAQKVEPYRDGSWSKQFQKGSLLEWFNPGEIDKDNDYWGGVYTFRDEATEDQILGFGLYKR